jgi:MFS family permease
MRKNKGIKMNHTTAKMQITYLFFSSLIILFVGMGLFPILPFYAAEFNASAGMVGIFFAIMYLSNGAGPMLVDWLSKRLTRKGLFVISAALGVPALALLGQANALWQVIALTALVWFVGGTDLALIKVFTGLYTDKNNRGRSFSLMSLGMPLGALVGGTVVGKLVASHGYPVMFLVLAGVWLLLPLIGMFGVQDKPDSADSAGSPQQAKDAALLGAGFYVLLGVSLLAATSINAARLGSSLSMKALDFPTQSVANANALSGLLAIPAILLIGTLSDRVGRKHLLITGYLLAAGGALTLSMATQLWQFWLSAWLMMVSLSANNGLVPALAADILSSKAMSRGISWLHASGSMAGVLTFASSGYLMDSLGPRVVFLAAAALPILAVIVLDRMRVASQPAKAAPAVPLIDCKSELTPSCLP